mmetsp:Transcript_30140/g.54540  ORF Transcript_30140/g.54540 Transcript_30140/m.54540 type:complete len:281 (+) Transcript_30140:100-942(+)
MQADDGTNPDKRMHVNMNSSPSSPITTLIFDVDDTLYDVGTSFTSHRNEFGAQSFMVKQLGFASYEDAKRLRDEYFERYHSTAKALTVAEQEGRLPNGQHFDPQDLAEYWATSLDFDMIKDSVNPKFANDLQDCNLNMVAFSNGPGKYVRRVLKELDLDGVFGDQVFAVDDVLPFCKPEKEAFEFIFTKVGCKAKECVMIEDSMKNVRKAKELGMKTVLVIGKGRSNGNNLNAGADDAEATKPGDAPIADDPAVDVAIESVDELRSVLPGLWQTPAIFEL